MTDGAKRSGGEPVFDTDRAWDRFKQLTDREPVPAYWRQAEEFCRVYQEKDGAIGMNQAEDYGENQKIPVTGTSETSGMTKTIEAASAWQTEKPAKRRLRRWSAGAAAAILAVGLFATPLGDRALAVMQQTFRIQHMVGVGLSADDMTAISDLLERGSPEGDRNFDLAQYGTLTQSGGGKAGIVTWEEAEQRMGASLIRLETPSVLTYQSAATLTFNLNVKAVNRLLTRLGSATTLPAEADGQAIRLYIPDGLATEGILSGKPVRLLQFGKPELTMEDGIDAVTVREAVLGLPVLPESLRTKLAAIGDWRSTLPVPARDGVTANLRLRGHDAVMTVNGKYRYLLWIDGERMRLLSGETKDFPTDSSFRQAAEELIQP